MGGACGGVTGEADGGVFGGGVAGGGICGNSVTSCKMYHC